MAFPIIGPLPCDSDCMVLYELTDLTFSFEAFLNISLNIFRDEFERTSPNSMLEATAEINE